MLTNERVIKGYNINLASDETCVFQLLPENNQWLNNLCGPCNAHIHLLENFFGVSISHKSNQFHIQGVASKKTENLIKKLYEKAKKPLSDKEIDAFLMQHKNPNTEIQIVTRNKTLQGRNTNQKKYLANMSKHPLNFAIGPAGTGKTFLAVAKAVESLEQGHVQRLIFVRPAVEAGEKLGFLPGNLVDKVLPYLRPIYDALYELMGVDETEKHIQQNVIEIVPLAFMRGRTLNDAFIILDEAQNATIAQMKMFLTRIGFGSNTVVTGDITQIDLPSNVSSGLNHAIAILKKLDEVSFTYFTSHDVVRHPLVSKIINAYERAEKKQ